MSSAPSHFEGKFSPAQTAQLLAPIKPNRVLRDGKGNSHVSQQDVTAHLIRVFGFGNFSTELLGDPVLLFETVRPESQTGTVQRGNKTVDLASSPHLWKYDVAYRATMRVSIYDEHHNFVTSYEDSSTGDAQNQTRADAHDLALKSAISLAKKRACINLGDQFGLSLYNKGQMAALVGGTHVLPAKPEGEEQKDLQDDVAEQVSMGVDEIEKAPAEPTSEQEQILKDSLGATKIEERPATADEAAQAEAGEESQA